MDLTLILDWIVGLLTLTALEIVLGIDNIVVISILAERLPESERPRARRLGLFLALGTRLLLLSTINYLVHLTDPIFLLGSHPVSIKDAILFVGGLFLMAKATTEIFNYVELREEDHHAMGKARAKFAWIVGQILVFDVIFSLDSILTAVGLTDKLPVMFSAVIIAVVVMIVFVNQVSDFVSRNPAIKVLALSFLVLIGFLLMAEGTGTHFEKGYVYFAMAFSLIIELLNRRRAKKLN